MRKLLTLLLAALMLLSCLTALAESEDDPFMVSELGLRLSMDIQYDIMDRIDNVLNLDIQGIYSHKPFVSIMGISYVAIQKDDLEARIAEMEAAPDQETQLRLAQECMTMFVPIAEVAVTQYATPEEYMAAVGWKDDEILEIREFGAVDDYHFYYLTLPVEDVIAQYDELQAFGEDEEAAGAAREKAREEIGFCQDAMLRYLESAGLIAPVDPDNAYLGQVIQFETTDLDGNPVKSEDLFKDNEITMVNLWGTWCPNCVNEMAELAQMHTRLQEKGCGIVGIEYEQKPIEEVEDAARAIMTANGTNYPSVLMAADDVFLRSTLYYPTTYFVDREGRILTYRIEGAAVDEYEATIDKLLAGEAVDAAPNTGAAVNGDNKYCVYVYDQDGSPVAGALVQFCDAFTCSFQPTDENGVAEFPVSEQKVYEVHLLSVPEGYRELPDTYKTLDTYSDVNIYLEKAE